MKTPMRRMLPPFNLAIICLLHLALQPLAAAEKPWNQFRGPNGDGHSTAQQIPITFSEKENVTWKTAIHGLGWSSPVIFGDQIWMQTATPKGHSLFAVCVNATTGKVEHDIKLFQIKKPRFRHASNSYASPTPFLEKDRVYVHFGAYGTACLNTKTGKKIWERRDFKSDDFRGPGSSPIIDGNLLFLIFDGFDFQFVIALDKKTGKTVWKTTRDIDYKTTNGDNKKAYATPKIITVNGQKQLICPSAIETIAYNPQTGKPLWRISHGGRNTCSHPLFAHGFLYITTCSGTDKLLVVRPPKPVTPKKEKAVKEKSIPTAQRIWGLRPKVPRISAPLILNDLLFMINDGGVVSCLNAKTGQQIWSKRLQGQYWSSPVLVGDTIYCCSKEGHISVFKASKKYELLASNKLNDGFNASPAFQGNAMFLRSFTHLYRIEKQNKAKPKNEN